MDDAAIYTSYYSPYYLRAVAEAESAASPPKKRQCLVCALLTFGAACGIATVAVGFYAHNPVITWPVVAVGLLGVVAGVTLAHVQVMGGWRKWISGASTAQQAAAGTQQGVPTAAAVPAFHTPMYYADAHELGFDLEMGAYRCFADGTGAEAKAGAGKATAQPKAAAITDGGHDGGARLQQQWGDASTAAAAAAATAAAVGCGAVACAWPAAGGGFQDGRVDTRPVLVLQPHPLWANYFGPLPVAPAPPPLPQQSRSGSPPQEDAAPPPPSSEAAQRGADLPLEPEAPAQEPEPQVAPLERGITLSQSA